MARIFDLQQKISAQLNPSFSVICWETGGNAKEHDDDPDEFIRVIHVLVRNNGSTLFRDQERVKEGICTDDVLFVRCKKHFQF